MNETSAQDRTQHKWEKNAFFASANGFDGFRSRYGELYRSEEFTRVFVIKGGPGTGKSRLMSEIGTRAKEIGAESEYFYCSSDPDSLDGVIVQKGDTRIAVLDATAPHTRCADIPGAIDEIVNLGDFWNGERLAEARKEILSLCKEKADCYRRAYRYLGLAGEFDRARETCVAACLDREKLLRAARRELRLLKISREPKETVRYLSAFGMGGRVRLRTWQEEATVVSVSDLYGSARFYLGALLAVLREEGLYNYCLIPSCYADKIPEGIYLPENKLLFLANAEDVCTRSINMKRFLSTEKISANRQELRLLDREYERMLAAGEAALQAAGHAHFALEGIYGETMDFEAKEVYSARLTERIVSLLIS